jgi:hypothetical protein
VEASFVRRTLSLTTINPELINRIFEDLEPEGVSLETLIRGVAVIWDEQPT